VHSSANLLQIYYEYQVYSKYIPKLYALINNIKLKQKFDLFAIKYFFNTDVLHTHTHTRARAHEYNII